MSKAVLTAPLERSTCPYQWSLLSFRMRSRSSMPSRASSSVDLMLALSCGLTLPICPIIALSFPCRCWRQGFVTGQVSLAWSIALSTHVLYTRPRVLKERWQEERTGISSLNFFQAVFHTCCGRKLTTFYLDIKGAIQKYIILYGTRSDRKLELIFKSSPKINISTTNVHE